MKIVIKLMVMVLLSALSKKGFSQSDTSNNCIQCCCSSFDPTPSGVMISHVHQKNQWMFSYRYMNMIMGDMRNGTEKISDNTIFTNYLMSSGKMRMDMHMLMAMYGISNRLTLMGMCNYTITSMEMKMLEGTTHVHNGVPASELDNSIKSSGINDIKIQALYGLINQTRHHLLIGAGLSFPVGSIECKGNSNSMYQGQRIPYAMQMGSGTWDVLPVVNYLFQKNRITWSSQISSVIRTGTNKVGYTLGNEVTTNHWLAFRWANNFSSSFRFEGNSAQSIRGKDKTLYSGYEPSANPYNYGGQRINGFLGTTFHFTTGFLKGNRIGIEYGLPLYQNLFGPQMGMKSSLYASLNINL